METKKPSNGSDYFYAYPMWQNWGNPVVMPGLVQPTVLDPQYPGQFLFKCFQSYIQTNIFDEKGQSIRFNKGTRR